MNEELKEALQKAIESENYPQYLKDNMKQLLQEIEEDEQNSNNGTN